MPIIYSDEKRIWIIQTHHTSYSLGVDEKGNLQHLYWGPGLPYAGDFSPASLVMCNPPDDIQGVKSEDMPDICYYWEDPQGMVNQEYPAWGGVKYTEPCLKVRYPDGVRDLVLAYEQHEIKDGKHPELIVTMKDPAYHLTVKLHYRVYEAFDLIERFAEILNTGTEPVTLESVQTAAWFVPRGENYRLTHLTGKLLGETQIRQVPITPGKKILESRRGCTSHHANPWCAIDRGDASEEHGELWFGALGWSGNWKITVEMTNYQQVGVVGGLNDFDFSWLLGTDECFSTPIFTIGFTQEGFGGASRRLHQYEREHILPAGHANELRRVLYNSWEATAFDVNEKDQMALAEKAASIGVELFVVDDGWFGQRHTDKAGLGDWYVNRDKFPNGLKPLIQKVQELGMAFGIWVEPEMVNPDSDLYRAHPDWVYHFPTRPGTESRNQFTLNYGKREVTEYIFGALDELLSENDIAFVKWDHNRNISEPGWPEAPLEKQKEIWVRHVQGFYEVLDRLRAKHPKVLFESCAGGGARIDLGVMRRADQFWTSDNTDPMDRLKIQEGFSQAYCAKAMMAWVTDSPNFVNLRHTSLRFRFHSAMMGSLGIGCNLNKWKDEDFETAREMISLYKQVRHIVQDGKQYRLLSPRAGNTTAVQYVTGDGSDAVVFVLLHSAQFADRLPQIRLKGLDPERLYRVDGMKELKSGAALMKKGIELRLKGDFASRMIRVMAEEGYL